MRREIGSEFWNIPCKGKNDLLPHEVKWFISGRSPLTAIIEENHFQTVAVPDWCCDSMITPFLDAGIHVIFYPALGELCHVDADAALIMDYFGYTGHSGRGDFQGVVIRDITHSVFSASYNDADYYIGSLRKWAGFWTGGFAWGFKNPIAYAGDSMEYTSLRKQAMENKLLYIEGKTESKEYLTQYRNAEEMLETNAVLPAAQRDIDLAGCMDIGFMTQQRRKNATILMDAFSDYLIFPEIKNTDCPMFVPIYVEKRNELYRYLIQNEIYCPIHWPVSEYHCITEHASGWYEHELSLVCDQRYTEDDMQRIVATVKKFFHKEK